MHEDSKIESDLIKRRLEMLNGEINPLLPEVLKRNFPKNRNVYLLHMMPDQGGEVFWVLVEKNTVAVIEIPWPFLSEEPEISLISAEEYASSLSKESRENIFIAQNLFSTEGL